MWGGKLRVTRVSSTSIIKSQLQTTVLTPSCTELLLGFFQSTKYLLTPTGTAIITLFEGTPYELWDVKSLAKSAGFRTRRSFVFQSSAYPGYKHARTLGNIEGAGGGWKGEERKARTYVFELVEDKGYSGEKTGGNAVEVKRVKKSTKRERRWGDASDDEDI